MNGKTEIYREKMIDAATNLILTKMEELRGDKVELKEIKSFLYTLNRSRD